MESGLQRSGQAWQMRWMLGLLDRFIGDMTGLK
jgi:hypothetical protein